MGDAERTGHLFIFIRRREPSKPLRNSWSASSFVILPAFTIGCDETE